MFGEQLERLNRGLVAVKTVNGIFLSWRLFLEEVSGYSDTGMTGTDFRGIPERRTDRDGDGEHELSGCPGNGKDRYAVAPIKDGREGEPCGEVKVWEKEYLDIPFINLREA